MNRERALKIVLVLVGLLFCAAIYPLVLMAKQVPALAMTMSLYVTLGVFLMLASRNPSAHRSLIAFTAWSSFAHATVMGVQAYLGFISGREIFGVATFIVIGAALISLVPAEEPTVLPKLEMCCRTRAAVVPIAAFARSSSSRSRIPRTGM
jgi:hypothetical protein